MFVMWLSRDTQNIRQTTPYIFVVNFVQSFHAPVASAAFSTSEYAFFSPAGDELVALQQLVDRISSAGDELVALQQLVDRISSDFHSQDVTARLTMLLAGVVALVLALVATAFYSKVCNESPIDPVALSFSFPPPKLVGVFAPNQLLQGAEKLGVGKLPQAEDFVLDPSGQFFYVSTADGWVKKLGLKNGQVEDWKFVGGRPLGLAVGRDGELIVCEADQGLLKVTEEGVEVLANEVDGTKILLADGAAVAKDGLIYFTDASTKFKMETFMYDHLEGRPNGRILVYNPVDKSTEVLVKDLYFPNGIALSKGEEFLIFAETTTATLSKYYLKGEKKGTKDIINEELPGFPDNIHYNYEKGILYVGIVAQRDAAVDLLWKLPFVKKVFALFPSIQASLDASRRMARVLAVDENGKPLKMYQDPTGKVVGFVTAAVEVDGYLYVGGLRDEFIARVPV